jgi:hypothetical protein
MGAVPRIRVTPLMTFFHWSGRVSRPLRCFLLITLVLPLWPSGSRHNHLNAK